MNAIDEKLLAMGIILEEGITPLAAYVPAKRTGNLVFTSGQLPIINGEVIAKGQVQDSSELEEAKNAAKVCTINALTAIKANIGSLDKIVQIIKVVGYVSSSPTFTQQPYIINGASEFLNSIFGEKGHHARSAIGVTSLPLNSTVEVELIVEIL
jgi:enamine deaminase RidA (YjgF/YER057c/UK114 family)